MTKDRLIAFLQKSNLPGDATVRFAGVRGRRGDEMNLPEFQVGQPVIEYATMLPSIISAVHTTLTGRVTYSLEGGSSGLTPNMIESIVGVAYEAESVRSLDGEGRDRPAVSAYRASLVIKDGERFSPPSEEFLTRVHQWLKEHR